MDKEKQKVESPTREQLAARIKSFGEDVSYFVKETGLSEQVVIAALNQFQTREVFVQAFLMHEHLDVYLPLPEKEADALHIKAKKLKFGLR
jgi:hypothetical protein